MEAFVFTPVNYIFFSYNFHSKSEISIIIFVYLFIIIHIRINLVSTYEGTPLLIMAVLYSITLLSFLGFLVYKTVNICL